MKIENWSLFQGEVDGYTAPELIPVHIIGEVYGNPKFTDGTRIRTACLEDVDREKKTITTHSGSVYELAAADEEYESLYPNAVQRFWE